MTDDIPEPSTILREQIIEHLRVTGEQVTLIATRTGVGYYRLLRWIKSDTDRVSYDDAVRVREYLGL